MYILSPSSVEEGESFTVVVRQCGCNNTIVGAEVTFNDETKLTDGSSSVEFSAPEVDEDTVYGITASKDGFEDVSASVTVINVTQLDMIAPEIIDNTPVNIYTGQPFTFNATVWDNVAVAAVWVIYWYDTNIGEQANETMINTNGDYWEYTIDEISSSAQYLNYVISAVDTSGNDNITTTIHITDTIKPQIFNVLISPNPQTVNESLNITCKVTDNWAVVYPVMINITYPDTSTENVTMMHAGGTAVFYHNTNYSEIGNYSFIIWAMDTSGNANTSAEFNFSVISDSESPPSSPPHYSAPPVDAAKPEIFNIGIVPNPQNVDEYVNITCEVTDNWGVSLPVMINITYPNSSTINETMTPVVGMDAFYYNISYLDVGDYSFFIWAVDASGNSNISALFNFSIVLNSVLGGITGFGGDEGSGSDDGSGDNDLGDDDSDGQVLASPTWSWWIIGIIAAAIVILLIVFIIGRRDEENNRTNDPKEVTIETFQPIEAFQQV